MWAESSIIHESNKDSNYHPRNHNRSAIYEAIYTEDDDTTTTTGVTVSSIADQLECLQMPSSPESDDPHILFERYMKDPKNGRISKCQNTYFMDGGHRFISLPNLGNTSTKSASHISRVFEDWLQNKLYHQTNTDERLPILEDSVELLAEDIVNKLKSRNSVRGLTGLQQVYVQLRAGHVYSYNSLKEEGQPIITEDMQDFFQQFPLFIEITIYTIPRETIDYCYLDEDIQLLLSIENVTIDVTDPYYIMDSIQLIV